MLNDFLHTLDSRLDILAIMVGCIYRHPSANLQEFTSELKSIIKQLKNDKHEVFILGDMNVDFLNTACMLIRKNI